MPTVGRCGTLCPGILLGMPDAAGTSDASASPRRERHLNDAVPPASSPLTTPAVRDTASCRGSTPVADAIEPRVDDHAKVGQHG